jgi:hypothetical protein
MRDDEKPSPREVLSTNLRALMQARPDLGTIKKVATASKSNLSNGKIGRIYAASHTTDIDTLQALSSVFGVEPWQLLVPDMNPLALPRLADAAVLAQILDAVGRNALPDKSTHQLEPLPGRKTPALDAVTKQAGGKREVSKGGVTRSAPKSRAGRRA